MSESPEWIRSENFRLAMESMELQGLLVEVGKLALEGIETDGGHHKRWYLEEIAKRIQAAEVVTREPGIAP